MKRFEPDPTGPVTTLSGRAEREAHLAHVAATVPLIILHVGERMVHGRFLPPTRAGRLGFHPHSPGEIELLPKAGAKVSARYQGESGANHFETRLVASSKQGDWILEIPSTIASADRRNATRFHVDGEPPFGLEISLPDRGMVRYALRDISTSGVCIRVRLTDPPLDVDRMFEGQLEVPLIEPIPVRVHVLRLHDETEGGDKFCGARFVDMPLEARNDLALGLTRWDFLSNNESPT